jgi:GNAT superfamily N-acetyltransferase
LPSTFKLPSADLFPGQKLAALIHDPSCIVGVAEVACKIAGHIHGAVTNRTENAFNRDDSYLYICQIGVDDNARRQGVGTALIIFTRDWTRALGLTALQVDH